MREWLARLRDWIRRDSLDTELKEELRFHRAQIERDLQAAGTNDAPLAARRQLGNETRVVESARERWSIPALEIVLQDIRYAIRGLRRSPGFTASVIVTLALGIGANAAMFAVTDRLMFRPYPLMKDPSRVQRVYLQTTNRGQVSTRSEMAYASYLNLRGATHSFDRYVPFSAWRLAVGKGADTRVRRVDGVGGEYFDLFDAPPALGRYFVPAEDSAPDGTRVAVLSYPFWKSEFGGRNVLNEQLQIGTGLYTIIGVTPEKYIGTGGGRPPEILIPITTVPQNISPSDAEHYTTQYGWTWMELLVRRKIGITAEAAMADLTSAYIASRNAMRAINPRVLPDSTAHPRAISGPLKSATGPWVGPESRVLLWVSGVAVIVLLIACANVANLMFARVLRRQREIAVRLALGVSRRRLAAQFITEGVLLALAGSIAALFIAQWGGVAIRRFLLPDGIPFNLATDWRTMGAALVCALAAALLTVVGPMILAVRADLSSALKAGARSGTYHRSRTRAALLIVQAAMSVTLLVGAGLFVSSLRNVMAIPLGYDASSVLEVRPDFRGQQLDSMATITERRRLLAAAQAIPGVEGAARVNSTLFGTNTADLHVPGIDSVERLGRFNYQATSPDYFNVMRTRIVRGRAFDESDRENTPLVAVVSSAMGHVLWPGKDPIGQCLQIKWRNTSATNETVPCTTVIGVAEDAAQQSITDEERFAYYLPVDQLGASWASTILVRLASGTVDAGAERVRRSMQAVMSGDGFVIVRPVAERLNDQRRSWQLGATLFVAFGALALVVAAVGLYGVIAYNVAQRMHELGVRVALGARSPDIARLVIGQGISLAGIGVAAGLTAAIAASRWVQPLLYRQSARDPIIYALVGVTLIVIAVVASALPAFRASKADPNLALRSD